MTKAITGFSRLTKDEKIDLIAGKCFADKTSAIALIKKYWNSDQQLQQLHDEFIENTITNFYLPLGVAPNFLINGQHYIVPMVIEESSVVAAAANAAKFWSERGGFKTEVISTEKVGQVHFLFTGEFEKLQDYVAEITPKFHSATDAITKNMRARGGGIIDIKLIDKTSTLANYYQLHATFETKDSMGANFINSCLEVFAKILRDEADFEADELNVIMSILSNYVPNCIVRAEVRCPIAELNDKHIIDPQKFAENFVTAVKIAEIEPFRAVTHNKGIMNGIDAVVVATGNDFRAIEAGVHAYASKSGVYSSLSHAEIKDGEFVFWMEIPLALGTVGGLTALHPLVKFSHEMLGKPSAQKLMEIVAAAGLAQNFAALRSLTTTGIQEGHMKMHLNNIINQFDASKEERKQIRSHFTSRPVSHAAVVEYFETIRQK
ncbi:MAG: hydroxymethylglutaryl-CoA reductase, degradative [Flavobacterium sp.]|nr:hydroxymethylglutaryl-CoA reductase, degradative [Flavobacterium sp.]